MASKPRWSRRLPYPIKPLDGAPIKTLLEAAEYLQGISERRQHGNAWRHLAMLLLEAAERDGGLEAVAEQLKLALLLDGKLDLRATPVGKK